jgi:hypothetical protein
LIDIYSQESEHKVFVFFQPTNAKIEIQHEDEPNTKKFSRSVSHVNPFLINKFRLKRKLCSSTTIINHLVTTPFSSLKLPYPRRIHQGYKYESYDN